MPKEKIKSANAPVLGGWYTEVSWRRAPENVAGASGHVQIATVNLHSPFEFPEKDTGESFEAAERFDGWRITLDREGIDHLIEALCKARRQALPRQGK